MPRALTWLFALGLLVSFTQPVGNADIGFHLRIGRDILRSGHVPTTDAYSSTARGAPYLDQEWGSQALAEVPLAAEHPGDPVIEGAGGVPGLVQRYGDGGHRGLGTERELLATGTRRIHAYRRWWHGLWSATPFGLCPFSETTNLSSILWRKGSFGSDSASGCRFAERMLTASETLKVQGRNLVDFVEAAIRAQRLGRPHPSLLPVGTG